MRTERECVRAPWNELCTSSFPSLCQSGSFNWAAGSGLRTQLWECGGSSEQSDGSSEGARCTGTHGSDACKWGKAAPAHCADLPPCRWKPWPSSVALYLLGTPPRWCERTLSRNAVMELSEQGRISEVGDTGEKARGEQDENVPTAVLGRAGLCGCHWLVPSPPLPANRA